MNSRPAGMPAGRITLRGKGVLDLFQVETKNRPGDFVELSLVGLDMERAVDVKDRLTDSKFERRRRTLKFIEIAQTL